MLAVHENTQEIEQLDQRIANLKKQIREIEAEARALATKRDKLNEQFKTYRDQILELKNQRNSSNEKVKALKLHRDDARAKIAILIEEIKVRKTKIDELRKKKPKRSQEQLEKEFQELEWTIQTSSLDLIDEKQLVNAVKEIEPQLAIYRRIEKQTTKIAAVREEIETLEVTANSDHRELTAIAQKSQELHKTLVGKIEESRVAKAQADDMHIAYIEKREKAKSQYEELKGLSEQKKNLENSLRIEDKNKRISKEKALKEELESLARQKLQKGEKISWQEFQLLEDNDETPDSETQN